MAFLIIGVHSTLPEYEIPSKPPFYVCHSVISSAKLFKCPVPSWLYFLQYAVWIFVFSWPQLHILVSLSDYKYTFSSSSYSSSFELTLFSASVGRIASSLFFICEEIVKWYMHYTKCWRLDIISLCSRHYLTSLLILRWLVTVPSHLSIVSSQNDIAILKIAVRQLKKN